MAILEKTKTGTYKVISGNHCVAYAVKLAQAEVVSAYPITPQTQIVEKLAEFIASSEMKARFIPVESEHSALAVVAGAATTGVRTFTATARQGLLYMHELLHWVGRGMVPIVMAVVDGAIGSPAALGTDHDASLSQRDTGWLQFYCETNQEVLDTIIQAYRIAEAVSLPVMVCLDGFYLSHTSEPVNIPSVELVTHYLPKREVQIKVDPDKPIRILGGTGMGAVDFSAKYKRRAEEALGMAKDVAKQADNEFKEIFGRSYGSVECYKTEDAEVILVATSTIASITRPVIDSLREKGRRVGLLRLRMFRPFPGSEVAVLLSRAEKVAVIDRDLSGVLTNELKATMYSEQRRPPTFGFIAGISGIPILSQQIVDIVNYTYERCEPEQNMIWVGVPKP